MADSRHLSYVRTNDAPVMPPPADTIGIRGWFRENLFPNWINSLLTIIVGLFLALIVWAVADWALIHAVWTGEDRENCAAVGAGACWPFVWAKFPQWLYGFYPIDQRWRPTVVYLLAAAALVPMLMPSVPYKAWNALFLIVAFPLIALILLSGGNFDYSAATYGAIVALGLLASVLMPFLSSGLESGIKQNRAGLLFAFLGLLPVVAAFLAEVFAAVSSLIRLLFTFLGIASPYRPLGILVDGLEYLRLLIDTIPYVTYLSAGCFALAAFFTIVSMADHSGRRAIGPIFTWLAAIAAVLAIAFILDFDFGLTHVESQSWGGLLVTLVVSVTGIAASLPLGIMLALGRRSRMPIVRLLSVIFIEVWRGVPLITVLFMSSVMLPLFLPDGMNFDKLLRALIGISLFSAAYMAEVVRGGLQAIPKGQYEGAMALGLSYWQMMRKIVLPQALKISIPNIVGNFIGLFKDTTLVLIIGIYDFLGIITAGTQDAKWASPQTGNTGYFAAALIYWAFCFGMSRYAIYTERRLHTGHKR